MPALAALHNRTSFLFFRQMNMELYTIKHLLFKINNAVGLLPLSEQFIAVSTRFAFKAYTQKKAPHKTCKKDNRKPLC
jgi:hypothetical protein